MPAKNDGGADDDVNADLKEQMRAALDRKKQRDQRVLDEEAPLREKAHGSEVVGGGPRVHRRKAGGGGS